MKLLLLLSLLLATPLLAQQQPAPKPAAAKPAPIEVAWHDVTKWGVEGRGWGDQERKRWFDRLPAKAATRQSATEDILWALLNSAEFVFNH